MVGCWLPTIRRGRVYELRFEAFGRTCGPIPVRRHHDGHTAQPRTTSAVEEPKGATVRGRHRSARIGPAARAYLQRVGRRGSALGVVAVVALVPVVASAAMVVPSIATASSAHGPAAVSGVAAALAGQV